MKILQIFNKYLFEGGEEKSVERIFAHLSARHEIRQVSFDSGDWSNQSGIFSTAKQAMLMICNPKSIRIVRSELRRFRPDIILIHNLFPVGSAALLEFLTRQKLPVVYYVHNFRPFSVNGYLWADGKIQTSGLRKNFIPEIIHGSWQDSRTKTLWYAMIILALHFSGSWGRISKWIAISDFMRNTFASAGVPQERITVVRHSWRIRCDRVVREVFEETMPFVFLGRLSEQKGTRLLLEAWKIVSRKYPLARLLICGEGPLEGEVRRVAENNQTVEFRGFVSGDEKAEILLNCRCLLAPSIWYEPLGLVVYDGYEYSMPVVASRAGGLTEIVREGETGFLVKRNDARSLAEGMCKVIDLPDGGVKMGKAGRLWLEKNTTEKEWNDRIIEVFADLEK